MVTRLKRPLPAPTTPGIRPAGSARRVLELAAIERAGVERLERGEVIEPAGMLLSHSRPSATSF